MPVKIDQAAVDALRARIEALPPIDPDTMLKETMAGRADQFDANLLYIEDYCCIYSIENAPEPPGGILTHLSISQRGNKIPLDLVEEIAKAFGMGARSTWTLEIPLPIGHNVIKMRA